MTEGSATIRVLIVEDHPLMARGLRSLLEDCEDLEVVGEVASAATAVATADSARPDVVLMDLRLPDGSGVDASRAIRDRCGAAIVVVSAQSAGETVLAAVEAGASAYIVKSEPAQHVVDAVRRAAGGEMLIPAGVLRDLVRLRARRAGEHAERLRFAALLTDREREVLVLTAQGSANQTIAERLDISLTTVRTHVRSILAKLDAHSKLEAVARASELGLLGDRPGEGAG
ncbi:MAG TPA: response regulator transcription factor [Candidatus Dormibacteraeota bacterium]|nr:response regulator transcription factor [Candidatus Dormibacteraeota bacterium]